LRTWNPFRRFHAIFLELLKNKVKPVRTVINQPDAFAAALVSTLDVPRKEGTA